MFYPPFNASKTKCFSFKSGCVVWNKNGDMRRQLQPNKKGVLAVYIAAKKWVYRTGGEAFKRRLVHGFVLIIMVYNNLLKSFIVNVLKCKARLKSKFKCVCVIMWS